MNAFIHSFLRQFVHITVMVMVLACVVWGGVLVWIATGPRTLPYLSNQLERMLSGYAPGLQVTIEHNVVQWVDIDSPVRITAKNIRVLDEQGDTLVSIPELFIGLDPLYLMFFKPIPREVFIADPMFYVEPKVSSQAKDKNFEMARYYGYVQDILSVMTRNQLQHVRLKHIGLRNGKVIFPTSDGEHLIWNLTKLEGSVLKSDGASVMNMELDSTLGDIALPLKVNVSLSRSDTLMIKTHFTQITLAQFTQNLPEALYVSAPFLKNSTLVTDGWVGVSYNKKEHIDDITVHLMNGKGTFADARLFPEPVPFDQLESDIHLQGDLKKIDIHHASLHLGDKTTLGGNIEFVFEPDAFEVMLALEATHVPASRLNKLWPIPLHPISRSWVVEHIKEGFSPKAHVNFGIRHAYGNETEAAHTELLSLDSAIQVEAATVRYDPHFPAVKEVKATVTFSPEKMDVAVTHAKTLDSLLEKGSVSIPDFHATPLMLNVEGMLKGNVKDMVAFYEPHKTQKTPILSAKLSDISGKMDTAFSLAFPIDDSFSADAIGFSVDSRATDVTLPGLMGTLDATEGTLHLELDNQVAFLDGQVMLGSIPTTLRLKKHLTLHDEDPVDKQLAKYLFKFYVSGKELALFGAPAMPFIEDKVMVGLGITESKQQTDMVVTADLTDTAIDWGAVGWHKPAGESAFMEAAAFYKPEGAVRVPHFVVDSQHFKTKGDALFSPGFKALEYVTLDYLKTDKTDIKARYINTDKGYQLLISGDTLDARGLALNDVLSASEKKDPDYTDIRINIAQVLMQHDEVFYDLEGTVFCAISGCITAELSARLDDEGHDMSVSYQPLGAGKYALMVESNDGGKVLRGLGILTNAQGGSLRIDANSYKHPEEGHLVLEGEGILRAFTAVDTPIFTKILTLASFSGIGNLLTQSGIPFQRFDLPFRFENGVLYIKEGNGHGSSLGMTLEGKVDTNIKAVDLEGALVPASNINRAIEKVPVVGEILTGGKGEGIIAARYSIKGEYDDPTVLVNPLSILTPGLLRKIFDIF